MALPVTTADSVVYILTGILPVEALLHNKILTHYGAITKLPRKSTARRIAYRQLKTRPSKSKSWFLDVRAIAQMYDLPDLLLLLQNPPTSLKWKHRVAKNVDAYWKDKITVQAETHSSLVNLGIAVFKPGSPHPLLTTKSCNP